ENKQAQMLATSFASCLALETLDIDMSESKINMPDFVKTLSSSSSITDLKLYSMPFVKPEKTIPQTMYYLLDFKRLRRLDLTCSENQDENVYLHKNLAAILPYLEIEETLKTSNYIPAEIRAAMIQALRYNGSLISYPGSHQSEEIKNHLARNKE